MIVKVFILIAGKSCSATLLAGIVAHNFLAVWLVL